MKAIKLSVLAASVLGTVALAPRAEAITIIIAPPAFQVFEVCDTGCGSFLTVTAVGQTGHFTLQNNTNNYFITGFAVGNSDAQSANTTRPSWIAGVDTSDSFGFNEDAFVYEDLLNDGTNYLGFGSDSSFFWSTNTAAASPFVVEFTGPNGPGSCSGDTNLPGSGCNPPVIAAVPEPGSLALLLSGLIGFAFLRRRKRA